MLGRFRLRSTICTIAPLGTVASTTAGILPALRKFGQAQLGALLPKNCLAAELDAISFNRQDLYEHLVALAELVLHFLDTVLCNLRDVQEPIRSGEDLHKGAELGEPNHFTEIGLAYLRHSGEIADHLNGLIQPFSITGRHIHASRILNVNLDARCIDDPANRLAARPDQIADLVGGYLQGVDPWCIFGLLFAGCRDDGVHRVQQEDPSATRLGQRLPHDLGCDAHDLDVHLQSRDSLTRAGDLEIHVSIVVLGSRDVGQNGVAFAFLDQTHRDTGDLCLQLDTCLQQGKRRAAHRGHGGRSIGLEDVRHNPQGVGRFVLCRQNCLDGSPCKSAVADLATPHAGHAADLAYGKRREVVVQHEAPLLLALIRLHALHVVRCAQGGRDQRLCFTTSKQ